ncbi:MAG: hypothetical protein JW927_21000 [Deltaproteobacteria bacterium]|nr:hypothetical protein [Deltaproteobacteria bacterium]
MRFNIPRFLSLTLLFLISISSTTLDADFIRVDKMRFMRGDKPYYFCGANVWAWGGEGRAKHDDGFWQKGDPFTGDPPKEHQELNSIFDTDTSTHEIIKKHSIKMNILNSGN